MPQMFPMPIAVLALFVLTCLMLSIICLFWYSDHSSYLALKYKQPKVVEYFHQTW